uniref:Uncharacterized protein n=2 Tax=Anguilla anguilla TaxID=7936 RepID=A0A0E9UQT7_ANGAN
MFKTQMFSFYRSKRHICTVIESGNALVTSVLSDFIWLQMLTQ